jgi:hypothetical protein
MVMADPSLELLQIMVQRMLDRQGEHFDEFTEINARLASLERTVLSIRSDMVCRANVRANLQDQIDRVGARLTRVERRLASAD